LKIDILSLFPEYFKSPFEQSMLKRALSHGLIQIASHNIRDFATDKHRTVDDKPFGGGPGMVMKPGPIKGALDHVKKPTSHVIYLSPQGPPLTAKKCRELSKKDHLVVLCGHYEGIDQRIIENYIDEEISIGDFVLTSGCPAAICLIDATVRFIPGVLGSADSFKEDSFENNLFDHPHYTQPREFEGHAVPDVLLEGHHEKIAAWRHEKAKEKTQKKRPDLL
jgi:tRNA (guanine37-N1)-methyltransferase